MRLEFISKDTADKTTVEGVEYDVKSEGSKTFGGLYFFLDNCGPPKADAKLIVELWNAVHDGDLGAISEARAKVRAL